MRRDSEARSKRGDGEAADGTVLSRLSTQEHKQINKHTIENEMRMGI